MDFQQLVSGLILPLGRLVIFISIGLFIGNFLEAMRWTTAASRLATPLIRISHLKDISGASFSMAFFSGVAANTMLADAYQTKKLTRRELIFSNLFNSLPTYFLHLPTMFFIIAPVIKSAALIYLGLTVFSAVLRTFFVIVLSRLMLPRQEQGCVVCQIPDDKGGFKKILEKSLRRFKKRLRSILAYTLPIYIIFFFMGKAGIFQALQQWLAGAGLGLGWLPPQAMSIIAFQMATEFSAGVAAAGALLDSGSMLAKEVVLALLVGNILSSPMRAFRHQFPYYAGIFKPKMAMQMIVYNQAMRVGSLILVGVVYFVWG